MSHILRNVLYTIVYILIIFNVCDAAITFTDGKWETSFDCPEWSGPQASGDIGCDFQRWGDQAADGNEDQITTSANYSFGAGFRGMRQWVIGNGDTTVQAPSSQGKIITFPSPMYEIWIRFYIRYAPGFYFDPLDQGGHKILYFKTTDYANLLAVNTGAGGYHSFMYSSQTGGTTKYSDVIGFEDYFGDPYSDGTWHCIEVYMKSETVTSAPFDGVFRMWCDGDIVLENINVDLGMYSKGKPIIAVSPQSNFHGLPLFDAKYIDFDDIVIYNTQPPNQDEYGNYFIGPLETPSNPVVEILTESGQTITASVFTITGTATADTGQIISEVTCSGQTVTPDDGAWDEQIEAFTCLASLALGENTIVFIGSDGTRSGQDSITATRIKKTSKINGSATIKNATIHQ